MASDLADLPPRRPQFAPAQPLEITVREDGTSLVLHLHGEVDMASAAILATCLDQELVNPFEALVVDLAGVTFLDSTGINALVQADNQLASTDRALRVRNPSPFVERVFAIAGIDHLVSDAAPADPPPTSP